MLNYASLHTEDGVHGIKVVDGVIYIKDNLGVWNEYQSGMDIDLDFIPLNLKNISFEKVGDNLNIKWEDSPDYEVKITDGKGNTQIIEGLNSWKGTKLVYRHDRLPQNIDDGTIILDSKNYNKYKDEAYSFEMEEDKQYCISLFPYSETKVNDNYVNNGFLVNILNTPGSIGLISGNIGVGFLGEVSVTDFITGDALAIACGLQNSGTSQYSNEPWLKFVLDGQILYVSKKTIRHSISWDMINNANCVYDEPGSKVVSIKGFDFRVTLLRGAGDQYNVKSDLPSESGVVNHYSEWNKLMCSTHQEAITGNWGYSSNVESDYIKLIHNLGSGTSGMYNNGDIVATSGNGRVSWCQERTSSSGRLYRAHNGVSYSNNYASSSVYSSLGWRPALRLLTPTN